ncbi:MAG: cytidine deaminase [Candidatus Eremiobacteraeota bacterium]|nr:cytidine deaminase [Candidatus Eremiobacteraeota bacterium]MBV8367261.1 cytidine deaminase [Candidatus Eremiobacteraeota bacterium]
MGNLAQKAWETWLFAYAPYSQFRVGAALLAADGRIFSGASVENPSFGLSMCAERVAVGAAAAAGARSFIAVAVAGDNPAGLIPCGACRQVLAEFSPDLLVIRCRPDGSYEKMKLRDLMPSPMTGHTIETPDRGGIELAVG